MVYDRRGTKGNGITSLGHTKFCNCANITRTQLRNLKGVLAAKQIQLADFFFGVLIDVVDSAVRL